MAFGLVKKQIRLSEMKSARGCSQLLKGEERDPVGRADFISGKVLGVNRLCLACLLSICCLKQISHSQFRNDCFLCNCFQHFFEALFSASPDVLEVVCRSS